MRLLNSKVTINYFSEKRESLHMKNNLYLAALLAICLSINGTTMAKTIRLSNPVLVNANSETFGVSPNNKLPQVTLSDLLDTPDTHAGKPFQLSTKIAKVCQKKGCFFIAVENELAIRVSFKDYGFFIPTNSSGKTVVLDGELVQKQVSKKQAEHFKSDLKSEAAAISSGKVYEIVANSITIPLV